MKYAVVQCSNGAFSVVSEWAELEKAIANFHSVCTALWSEPDVSTACVAVVDERFGIHRIEYIKYAD